MGNTPGQVPNGRGHYSRHRGEKYAKRNYPSRFAARRAMLRRWALDWIEMGTYPCTGGDNVLHYHFGHSSARERWEGWLDLQRFRLRKRVLFPAYTVRRRLRHLINGKPDTGYMASSKRRLKNQRRNHNAARRKKFQAEGTPWVQCPKHGPQEILAVRGLTGDEPICIECI